jgi:hypothetical protein
MNITIMCWKSVAVWRDFIGIISPRGAWSNDIFMSGIFKLKLQLIFLCYGAEEVDEAEDYEAPGSNPGQELWNMKMCFSIRKAISNSLLCAARFGTGPPPSSDICERHRLVTWYQNGWRSNHNVGLRMLLVVGAGGGTSQASRMSTAQQHNPI